MPRILYVDDEPLIRQILADTLSEMDLTADGAQSGEDAISMIANHGRLDLLITDIRLGGISGWQVAEHARTIHPDLPIIYISGFPSPGKSLPGSTYIAKPFRSHELERAVRASLDGQTIADATICGD